MYTVFLLIHVIIAIALISLVLLQQGRGAEAGAAFGSGASATVFGSRGSASFLSRVTAMLATGFFVTSLLLAYFLTQAPPPASVTDGLQNSVTAPAAPTSDVPTAGDGEPATVTAPVSDVPAAAQPTDDGSATPGADSTDGNQ